MRIGMLADVYKPVISGVTNYISLNKSYLESLGHQVFVFTFGDEDFEDEEQGIIRSPGLPILDTGFYLSLRYTKKAHQLLKTLDVAHVHHPFISGSLALRYLRPIRIPIVFTNHTRYDLYSQAYLPAMPDAFSTTALHAYLPSFCHSCDVVIAPSEGMKTVLQKFGVDTEIDVVPNGVDLQPFLGKVEAIDRSYFGFKQDDILLVYSGRLGPEKNIPFLLRCFAGAAQAYENISLLIIGDGPERDNLEDRVKYMGIQERVNFTGMVPYDQIPRYLAASDIFVTASVTEVHPLSIIEAMAAGLPVLGIQSPGVGDTIINGETGFLVASEDLTGFTAKLIRLIVDGERRERMAEQARLSSQVYAIEKTSQLILERYQVAIERASQKKMGVRERFRRWLDGFR
jgi:1,2-diacylglycerol 3-alpha-glucosyltransferase